MNMEITTAFAAFANKKILVVGDVMIDRYIYGAVSRISPEAPVPIVKVGKRENRLGGAANVALNIKALGGQVWLCSMIGKDNDAAKFTSLLPEAKLPTEGLVQSKERPTTVKTRIVAQNQHLIRLDEETTQSMSSNEESQLQHAVNTIIEEKEIDLILIQDYNKGVIIPSFIKYLLNISETKNIPVVVDPKFHNFWKFKSVKLFKPNLSEVSRALGYQVNPTREGLQNAAHQIREKIEAEIILITLSEKGAYIDTPSKCVLLPTQARQIADVSGAGDSVISIASLALLQGMSIENIALLSNLAGGQVCEQFGVVSVNKEKLFNEFSAKVNEVNAV